jgi:hypothetical protein
MPRLQKPVLEQAQAKESSQGGEIAIKLLPRAILGILACHVVAVVLK